MEVMPAELAEGAWHMRQVDYSSQRLERPSLQEPYGFWVYRIPGDGQ